MDSLTQYSKRTVQMTSDTRHRKDLKIRFLAGPGRVDPSSGKKDEKRVL